MKNGRWEAMATPLLALFLMAAVALLLFGPFWFGPKESPRHRSDRKLLSGDKSVTSNGESPRNFGSTKPKAWTPISIRRQRCRR